MGDRAELYLVDEGPIPELTDLPTNQERYEALAAYVQANGAHWGTIELPQAELNRTLEEIDQIVEMGGFFPVLSFNHSPKGILAPDGDHEGLLGYFTPKMCEDMRSLLEGFTPEELARIEADDDTEYVYGLYLECAREAAKRHWGLAVLHF